MHRRTRNKMLIWIIVLGLANFVAYTVIYGYLDGGALNGCVKDGEYYLAGHFIRAREGRLSAPVSRIVWVYSYVHSISIWPTHAAVLVSMLILARPHIIATIKDETRIRGTALVTICITLIVFIAGIATFFFTLNFVRALMVISGGEDYGV